MKGVEILCDPSPFEPSVGELLSELSRVNFFESGLLVGSWPMVVYAQEYGLIYGLRTGDIDFAVVRTAHKSEGAPLPDLLSRLGYEPLKDYTTGLEKYVLDTFEVEFLMHRKGGRSPGSVELPTWKIAAQPLPFIDILFMTPVTVRTREYSFKIPSPEALMVHKLIIAQRRTGVSKDEKKEKDLQQCKVLSEIVSSEKVEQVLREKRMSREVRKNISQSCTEAGLDMTSLGLFWTQ